MNLKLKLAFCIYTSNVIIMLVIGLSFVFKNEFMPFHSEVIQTDWQDVGTKAQILYLGMMRTEGAGFIASATAFMFLLWLPFRKFEAWSYWAMSVIGVAEYLPTVLANYHVASLTGASPPWQLMLSLTVSLVLALILALSGHLDHLANGSGPVKSSQS